MFNKFYIGGETQNNKCEVHLNQPSTGFIQKSNPVSRFIRFQRGSKIEGLLFPTDPRETPKLAYTTYERRPDWRHPEDRWRDENVEKQSFKEVVILQVCIFGNDYMLAEYVFKDDMKKETKSMIFYHGTSKENWTAIQEEGFLYGRRYITDNNGKPKKEVDRCTYLATDLEEAKCYGEVVLQVEYNPFLSKHNNYKDGCWQVRVYEPIPIGQIKVISHD